MPQVVSQAKVIALCVKNRRIRTAPALEDLESDYQVFHHECVDRILLERPVQTEHENIYISIYFLKS